MKAFITASFDHDSKQDIDHFCSLVKQSGFQDFCFVRDYPAFDDPKEMMDIAKKEIISSDALLIDLTTKSTGRTIELGIAFAKNKKIIIIIKKGTKLKDTAKGVSDLIIEYETIDDILTPLTNFYNQLNNN